MINFWLPEYAFSVLISSFSHKFAVDFVYKIYNEISYVLMYNGIAQNWLQYCFWWKFDFTFNQVFDRREERNTKISDGKVRKKKNRLWVK